MGYAISFHVISFFISLFNPFVGFIGLTCSVLIRFQDRYPEIAQMKPFTFLFIGMLLGCYINRDKLSKIEWKQDKLLLSLLGISVVGLIVQNPGALIWEIWQYICVLGFYFFATRLLKTERHFITLFFVMALCISFMAYEAIKSVEMDPLNTPFIDHGNGRWQGLGYYKNANEYGQLMITTIPFLLGIVMLRKSLILSLVCFCMMGVMIYVMGKSMSRTCMATLGVMTILTFALRGDGNLVKKAVVGGLIGVMLVGLLSYMPGPIRDRLNTVREAGDDESFQGRVGAWKYGFEMLAWYPVTGVGKSQWDSHHGKAPHNSFIQIMAELGVPGIAVFFWIIALSFIEFIPILIPSNQDPPGMKGGSNEEKKYKAGNNQVGAAARKNRSVEKMAAKAVESKLRNNKTIAIAAVSTFSGFIIYIFLGNQGYGVWTYFYIGVCAAIRNLIYIPEPKKKRRFSNA